MSLLSPDPNPPLPLRDTPWIQRETTWAGIVKVLLDTASGVLAIAALVQGSNPKGQHLLFVLGSVAITCKLLASYATVAGTWLARLATVRLANMALPLVNVLSRDPEVVEAVAAAAESEPVDKVVG
jgi:hypothetical protein